MGYQIVIAPLAQCDFKNLKRYIARDSPVAAERFASLLRSKTKLLGAHPEMGRVLPEIGNVFVRELIIKNYRIIYEVNTSSKTIGVLRYWHAARGTPSLSHF